MSQAPHEPEDGTLVRKKANGLIICGRGFVAISICMFLIVVLMWGASVPESIRPLVVLIGGISFFGFIPTGVLGLILLMAGRVAQRRTP
jgi:hypothetical protein